VGAPTAYRVGVSVGQCRHARPSPASAHQPTRLLGRDRGRQGYLDARRAANTAISRLAGPSNGLGAIKQAALVAEASTVASSSLLDDASGSTSRQQRRISDYLQQDRPPHPVVILESRERTCGAEPGGEHAPAHGTAWYSVQWVDSLQVFRDRASHGLRSAQGLGRSVWAVPFAEVAAKVFSGHAPSLATVHTRGSQSAASSSSGFNTGCESAVSASGCSST
jgi:hypothetical protein